MLIIFVFQSSQPSEEKSLPQKRVGNDLIMNKDGQVLVNPEKKRCSTNVFATLELIQPTTSKKKEKKRKSKKKSKKKHHNSPSKSEIPCNLKKEFKLDEDLDFNDTAKLITLNFENKCTNATVMIRENKPKEVAKQNNVTLSLKQLTQKASTTKKDIEKTKSDDLNNKIATQKNVPFFKKCLNVIENKVKATIGKIEANKVSYTTIKSLHIGKNLKLMN